MPEHRSTTSSPATAGENPRDAGVPVRPRLDFLHGLRGLAALAIVVFHLGFQTPPRHSRPAVEFVKAVVAHGYLAVAVFLVLSGFLLSMPVVTNGLQLRGGVGGFMYRRALRILPPYYAAYCLDAVFFLGMHRLLGVLQRPPEAVVDYQMQHGYRWPSVLAHLLLVHNFDPEWVRGMDTVFWSIACEWQIYLLFALVLVPLWHRAGLWAPVALTVALGAAMTLATSRGWLSYALPSMIPVFAVGMAAAAVSFGGGRTAASLRRWPWGAVTAALFVLLCVGVTALDATVTGHTEMGGLRVPYYSMSMWARAVPDLLAALATGALIVWLTVCQHAAGGPATQSAAVARRIRGLLESRWPLALGMFGYSLYLTHSLSAILVGMVPRSLPLPYWLNVVVVMGGGTAMSLLVAYVFHLCFERTFMARETRGMFTTPSASRHT